MACELYLQVGQDGARGESRQIQSFFLDALFRARIQACIESDDKEHAVNVYLAGLLSSLADGSATWRFARMFPRIHDAIEYADRNGMRGINRSDFFRRNGDIYCLGVHSEGRTALSRKRRLTGIDARNRERQSRMRLFYNMASDIIEVMHRRDRSTELLSVLRLLLKDPDRYLFLVDRAQELLPEVVTHQMMQSMAALDGLTPSDLMERLLDAVSAYHAARDLAKPTEALRATAHEIGTVLQRKGMLAFPATIDRMLDQATGRA